MTAAPGAQRTQPRLPRSRDVLMEHVRAIGFTLRMPMLLAAALAALGTIALAFQIASGDMQKHLLAEPSSLPGFIGMLLAIAIWAREERFGPGFLWTLPVDRSRHALIKVLAGWVWLVAGLALYAVCQLVLALVSDGAVLPVTTMYVLTAPVATSAPLDPSMLRVVRWAPGPVVWLIPAAAATATYLLTSAFMLGARRPLLWVGGAVLLFLFSSFASHMASRLPGMQWLANGPERVMTQVTHGRYGLETLLTLRTWSLDNRVTLTTGERLHAWTAIPDLADWRTAALLWTSAGLLALWAAVYRHREQRHA